MTHFWNCHLYNISTVNSAVDFAVHMCSNEKLYSSIFIGRVNTFCSRLIFLVNFIKYSLNSGVGL